MAWQKGQSGNPRGGPKDKAFADALRLAVNEEHEPNKRKLRAIAEKLVEEALKGESWAIQQVADRLDGKPAQESTVTIDDKRDATDWSRAELVAFLNEARAGSEGTAQANGRSREPDSVH
jgi:hypothetical protein